MTNIGAAGEGEKPVVVERRKYVRLTAMGPVILTARGGNPSSPSRMPLSAPCFS